MVVPPTQPQDLERLRRSIAMMSPGTMALPREDALALFAEVQRLRRALDRLAEGLRTLLDEVTPGPAPG
jgi:ubiquinone biosynthesis protein UbiJ